MHDVFDGVFVKFQGHLPQHLRIPVFKKQIPFMLTEINLTLK